MTRKGSQVQVLYGPPVQRHFWGHPPDPRTRPRMCVEPLLACGRHPPGVSSGGFPGEIDDSGLDGLDLPPLREGSPNLVLSHSARSPITGLEVAEAKHVIATTRSNHCGQTLDV